MYTRAAATLLAVACAVALELGAAGALAREGTARNASALASEPLVLIVQGPATDWVRRVQGQLSDLPATIETASAAPYHEAPSRDELRQRLQPLAEQRAAALVASIVRVDSAGAPSLVAIWFSASELLYTRVLAQDWGGLSAADRSAALELAALSVRSAVRALTLDPAEIKGFAEPEQEPSAALGSAHADSSVVPPSAAATSLEVQSLEGVSVAAPAEDALVDPSVVVQTSVASAEHAASQEHSAAASTSDSVADTSASDTSAPLRLRWSSELAMVGYMQGEPALASLALQAGLGLASGAWGLTLLGQLGLPSSSSLGPARVELQRYALLTELGYSGWSMGAWQFGPLLRGGLTLTQRETLSDNPALAASRSTSQTSLLLGGGWSSEYRWSEQLGFFLRGVLDWQASPTKYAVVTTTGEPVVSVEAWAIQPSIELGGNWHW